jgi:hypothetical protein
MPHLVMLCRNQKVAFTFESSMHRNEEQSESMQMEVDLVAKSASQPTELDVTFDTKIMSSVVDIFGRVEGFVPIQAFALKTKAHSGGVVDPMLSNTTTKDECAPPVVGSSMEGSTLISIQPKTIIVPTTNTPSSFVAIEDLRIDVRVEVTKVMVIEE